MAMPQLQEQLADVTLAPQIVLNSALTMPLLKPAEAEELIAACGELGRDPSSDYFTKRTKNIAYVLCLNGEWFQIRANCFNQAQSYNDFSGGYQRCYREMPPQFIKCQVTQKVLNSFKSTYNIPDNEPILVQVQQSHLTAESEGKSLTGQGIHSDGADRAMLVCLERSNISGAESAIYADLEGKRSLIDPFILAPGQGMLWHDNQVFHDVQPAQVVNPQEKGTRTVLIAHYPAMHYLQGKENPNNSLGTNTVEQQRRLRNQVHS